VIREARRMIGRHGSTLCAWSYDTRPLARSKSDTMRRASFRTPNCPGLEIERCPFRCVENTVKALQMGCHVYTLKIRAGIKMSPCRFSLWCALVRAEPVRQSYPNMWSANGLLVKVRRLSLIRVPDLVTDVWSRCPLACVSITKSQ
jgi:hypothetical protein